MSDKTRSIFGDISLFIDEYEQRLIEVKIDTSKRLFWVSLAVANGLTMQGVKIKPMIVLKSVFSKV